MTLIADRPGPGAARPYRFPPVVRRTVGRRAGGRRAPARAEPRRRAAAARRRRRPGAGRPGGARRRCWPRRWRRAPRSGTRTAYALAHRGARHRAGDRAGLGLVPGQRAGAGGPAERRRGAARRGRAHARGSTRPTSGGSATTRPPRCGWTGPTRVRAPTRRCAPTCSARDNRYGRPMYGDPDSVAGLDVDDVTVFHSEWFLRPGTLLVAGDLDRIDLDALGAAAFAGTGGGPADAGRPDRRCRCATGRRIILVDRPGSVQSTLRLGHPSPHRAHPDHVPMTLAGDGARRRVHLPAQPPDPRGARATRTASAATSPRPAGSAGSRSAPGCRPRSPRRRWSRRSARSPVPRLDGVTEEELAVARSWRAGQLSVELQTPAGDRRAR